MAIPLIIGAVIVRAAPAIAKALIKKGFKKATKKAVDNQIKKTGKPLEQVGKQKAQRLAEAAKKPPVTKKPAAAKKPKPTTPTKMKTRIEFEKGKGLTAGQKAALFAAGATGLAVVDLQSDVKDARKAAKEKAAAARRTEENRKAATAKKSKVNQANKVSKEQSDPVSKKDPTEGGRFAFYPGEISRKEGYETMYEVDRNKMSDEVRESLEEKELYEGDSKGGRVGKGKKKKVSQAPRGVRSAIRGFKPNMGAGKGSKRTRGTGGGWV